MTPNNNLLPTWKILLLIVLFIIVGTGVYFAINGYFIEVLEILALIFFSIGVFLVFVYVLSKETFLWIIGQRSEYYRLLQATKHLSSKVANTAITWLPLGLKRAEKQRLKNDIPLFIEMQMMRRINQIIMQVFIGAFGAAFALLGTLALMQQNTMVREQTSLMATQTKLMELEIRSAEAEYINEITSSIDRELEVDYGKDRIRNLSPQLIGRIIVLSNRLKPYTYLDGDTLIEKPLSPERGQLLINLIESKLDTITYNAIFKKADFSYANLVRTNFDSNVYLKDINLRNADLFGSNLSNANLIGADLINTNLSDAYLVDANLENAILTYANLRNSILFDVNLRYANLIETDLRNTDLSNANLINANLISANLTNANLTDTDLKGANLKNVRINKEFLKRTDIGGIEQLQKLYKEIPLFIDTNLSVLKPINE